MNAEISHRIDGSRTPGIEKNLYSKKYSMGSKTHAKILLALDENQGKKLPTIKNCCSSLRDQ